MAARQIATQGFVTPSDEVAFDLGDGCWLRLQRLADDHVSVEVEAGVISALVTLAPDQQRRMAEILRPRPALQTVR